MYYEVVTSTGSVYYIDYCSNRWTKNIPAWWSQIVTIAEGEWDGTRTNVPDFRRWPKVRLPSVGSNMYIQGRGMDDWYLTTPVVEVREVEGWE